MDDAQLVKLASNNPGMSLPASSELSGLAHRTRSCHDGGDAAATETQVSDPTGIISRTTRSSLVIASKYDRGWRRVVRNFTPSWFSVTMGTGIVSLLLINIPWKADWLYWLSVLFFVLNLILFSLAFIISFLRYTLYPEIWTVMVRDPNNSLFISTATMGFATLISSFVSLCCPYWGSWATILAWALWMLDSIWAFAVTVSLSFVLISQTYLQSLDRITAVQLLPIASTIVASGTGSNVCYALTHYTSVPHPGWALGTWLTSYVMWGMSTPFALVILVIYYQRLAVHKLPPRETIVSSFLPIGPLGMGGYAIAFLGAQAETIITSNHPFLAHVTTASDVIYILGLFIALIMFAFGIVWLAFAVAAIYNCGSFPFNMGWWGFTFPLGVFALSTMRLGVEFPSLVFRVLGTIFAVLVVLLWIVVFAGTVRGAWRGNLFYAPCLKNLPADKRHGEYVKEPQAEDPTRTDQVSSQQPDSVDLEKGIDRPVAS